MYEVLVESGAHKDLRKVPAGDRPRLIAKLRSLRQNPRPAGCVKLSGTDKYWRVRAGDYRILYFVDDPGKTVRVTRVKRRREVYR